MNDTVSVIIAAAGSGVRMKSTVPKQFVDLCGMPVLARTIMPFQASEKVSQIIIVTKAEYEQPVKEICEKYSFDKITDIVIGGMTRQESVEKALSYVKSDNVLIHDGVRPFVTEKNISDISEALLNTNAATLGVPVSDTLKSVDSDMQITKTHDRNGVYGIQTPQGFNTELIKKAHRYAEEKDISVTDDCALCEALGEKITVIKGSPLNIKITTPDDFKMAEMIVSRHSETHTGFGYDVHRLVENRDLILGGVKIPYKLGLLGHSDADVLTHAIMDSLLGAAGLGDIGRHFPDTDSEFKDADSIELLKKVVKKLLKKCAVVLNVDATLIAQEPKISPYVNDMRQIIASALNISESCVNIKATTTEKLGFCGRGEGMAAEAVCAVKIYKE